MSAEAPAPSPMQPRPRPPVAKSNRAQIITFTLLTLLLSAVTEAILRGAVHRRVESPARDFTLRAPTDPRPRSGIG